MTPEEFNFVKEPRSNEPPTGFIEIPVVRAIRGKFEARHNDEILFTVRLWFLNAEIQTSQIYKYTKSFNPFDLTHTFQSPLDQVTLSPKGGMMSGEFTFSVSGSSYEILPSNGGSKLINAETQTTVATFAPAWRESDTNNQINGRIHALPEVPILALAILFLSPQLHDGNNSTPEGLAPTFRPD